MVIINPGNPTGQCLSQENLREVLQFCYEENLVLLGDEVYQTNIYQDERPFISSKKVYFSELLFLGIYFDILRVNLDVSPHSLTRNNTAFFFNTSRF